MINALNPKRVVIILAVIMIGLLTASWLLTGAIDAAKSQAAEAAQAGETQTANQLSHLFEAAKLAVFALNCLLVMMGWWRFLWFIHTITFARSWWFPWLGGDWRGEVTSNWPRVEAMMLAARGARASFDTMHDAIESLPVKVKARIRCGLFSIRIHLTMDGSNRSSETIFVRPEWKPERRPKIYYIYKQRDQGKPPVTDVRSHLGAAALELSDAGELVGTYWTARNEERGLTTAGTLTLRRAPKLRKRMARKRKPIG